MKTACVASSASTSLPPSIRRQRRNTILAWHSTSRRNACSSLSSTNARSQALSDISFFTPFLNPICPTAPSTGRLSQNLRWYFNRIRELPEILVFYWCSSKNQLLCQQPFNPLLRRFTKPEVAGSSPAGDAILIYGSKRQFATIRCNSFARQGLMRLVHLSLFERSFDTSGHS